MCFFLRGLGLMVIPWLMGFPVEMRLGAVGAPEEHRKVKRWSGVVNLREASGCDLKNFYGLDKETSKMANQLEINSIWKKYIVPWMAFYMLKCIPSGKMIEKELSSLLSAASIVSVKVHNQVERLNQNGTMRITRTTKKVSRHDVARYQEGSGYQTLSILKILF